MSCCHGYHRVCWTQKCTKQNLQKIELLMHRGPNKENSIILFVSQNRAINFFLKVEHCWGLKTLRKSQYVKVIPDYNYSGCCWVAVCECPRLNLHCAPGNFRQGQSACVQFGGQGVRRMHHRDRSRHPPCFLSLPGAHIHSQCTKERIQLAAAAKPWPRLQLAAVRQDQVS